MRACLTTRRRRLAFIVAFLGSIASATAGAQSADSTTAATAGEREGSAAGRSASLSGVRWSSAAATFFLTPFIGGAAVIVRSGQDPDGVPTLIPPPPAPLASSASYERAYRDAYRAEYLPRRRHTMRSTMIVTSVLFIAAAAAFSG
ncbi:MAG: hypothetical protein DMD35_19605 [Gemmatimonadetes bacterium]|nr:MAG: hypothetical protein DMD35_19605 [Gemmatimonadota bacterium]